ncbi:MAG: DNA-binding response regulator [Acidobacteria bacterium 13_1_40CM_2_68_5]|nr:MAG: DNA-binding response regulator [Acidobacteria bacterium 13_1_40CM_2_68_5]
MPIQVLLADDHQIVRQGLRAMLEHEGFKVVGEASDGREAIRMAETTHPDVAILDLAMPALNGLDAAREILRGSSRTKAILLTMHTEDPYVLEALRAGISGYVLKTQAALDLVQAIREVTRGAIYLSPGVSKTVVDAYRNKSDLPPDPLSPREREVLQLVAEGKTTKEVAALLGVSVKTAESHRTRIMSKLGIHETAGLVRYAIRRGIVQP